MAEITVIASGLRFPEGPAVDSDGRLVVVELGGGRVSRIGRDGVSTVLAECGGAANGSAFGPDGALYVCNNGGRHPAAPSTGNQPGPGGFPEAIQRVSRDGEVTVALREIDGIGLNAPNDICFDQTGGYWFSDPRWEGTEQEPVPKGDLGYVSANGTATRVPTDLRFPNGVGLTDDGATLLVTESSTGRVWAFPLAEPGVVGAPRVFAECGDGALPDGFAIDAEGRVLVAGHGTGALHVFDAEGRREEDVVLGAELGLSNLCFDPAPGEHSVFITASGSGEVLRMDWKAPGMPLFPRG
jgi:gluconolactonase